MISTRFSKLVFPIIALGFLLTQLSGSLLSPVLPTAAKVYGVSPQAVKYFVSIYFAGYAVGQIFWGTMSDHFGRRYMARWATIMYVLCVAIIMCWHHILFFYLNYLFIGFACANYTSVGNAMLKDIFSAEQLPKIIAFIGVVMGSGPVLSAFIATNLVAFFGWDSLFVFLLIIAALVLVGMFFIVPETKPAAVEEESVGVWKRVRTIVVNKKFQRSILMLSISFGAFASFLATGSLLFHQALHLSSYASGWLMLLPTASFVSGALFIMFKIKNKDPWHLMCPAACGVLLVAVVFVVCQWLGFTNVVLSIGLLMAALFQLGMLVPLSKSGCMTALTHSGGTTASLMKLIQSICASLLAFCFALVSGASFIYFATLLLVAGLLMTGLVLLYRHV